MFARKLTAVQGSVARITACNIIERIKLGLGGNGLSGGGACPLMVQSAVEKRNMRKLLTAQPLFTTTTNVLSPTVTLIHTYIANSRTRTHQKVDWQR